MKSRLARGLARIALALPVLTVPGVAGRNGSVEVSSAPSWVRPVAEAPAFPRDTAKGGGGGSEYLLVDHQCDVGSMATYTHTVTRIADVASFDEGPDLRIEYDPAYERLTVHFVRLRRAEGAIDLLARQKFRTIQRETSLDEGLVDARLTALLLMEDLRNGDTLDYAYTIAGKNPVFGGRYMESTTWAYGVPVRLRTVSLRVPEGRRIERWASPRIPAPDSVRANSATEYRWIGRDLAAVTEDDNTPEWYDPYPELRFSEFHDWKGVVEWANGLYSARNSDARELAPIVERLSRDHPGAAEYAAAALQFVQDEVRYYGIEMGENSHRPTPPAEVLRQRFGDCKDKAFLYCALLAARSVRADPVLVDSYDLDRVDPARAWPLAFDHVIVRVEIDGRAYFVDPTVTFQRGTLEARCVPQAMKGLVVAPAQDTLVAIPEGCGLEPSTLYEERFTVHGSDSVEVEATTTYHGRDADDVRAALAKESASELARGGAEYFEGEYGPVRTIRPLQLVWDDTAENSIRVSESYAIDSFWRGGAGSIRAAAMLEALGEAPSSGRSSPLSIGHPVNVAAWISIVYPGTPDVDETSAKVDDPAFGFTSRVDCDADTVKIRYVYVSRRNWVSPGDLRPYAANLAKARALVGVTIPREPMWKVPVGLTGLVLILILVFRYLRRRAQHPTELTPL